MGRRKQEKKSRGDMSNINPALVPSVAFSVVPRTPAPQPQPVTGLGGSTEVLNTSLLGRPPPLDPRQEDEPFSDPESSLYDYQAMDEPGYSSVEMLAVSGNRRSMSDRPPARTPPSLQREHDIEEHQQSTSRHMTESAPDPAALYSRPIRKEERGSSSMPQSLQRTANDVREAMRAVHEMSSDDEGQEPVRRPRQRPRKRSHKASAQSLHFPVEHDTVAKVQQPPTQSHTSPSPPGSPVQLRHHKSTNKNSHSRVPVQEVIEPVIQQKQESQAHSPAEPIIEPVINSARSRPQSAVGDKIRTLEAEREHLATLTQQLETEVQSYREVVSTYESGASGTAESLLLKKQLSDIKEENESLKSSIHRLSVELSSYQARYRPVSAEQMGDVMGLPSKGPLPSWLPLPGDMYSDRPLIRELNIRYLNPLFLAYDDRLRDREETIKKCQLELDSLKGRTEDVVKENERLHLRLEQSGSQGPVDITEWEQLKENARLVLEENQNLLEQINIKDQKSQDLHQAHVREVSKLSKQLVLSKAEKSETEQELDELRQTLRDLKQKHEKLVLDTQHQITMEQHIQQVTELKQSVSDKEERHRQELNDSSTKLQALQVERKTLANQVVDLSADNKRLQVEVKTLHKSVRKSQDKMRRLIQVIEDSENKEMSVQEYLSSAIKLAEKNKFERDTYAKVAKEQEMETKKAMNRLLHGNLTMGKMEEKLKLYKMKAAAKISTVADRLKQQDEIFNTQKKEYEREITHLRILLSEKETLLQDSAKDKRHVEDELEAMWQAANTENARIREQMQTSITKLRQHTGLSKAIDEHDRLEAVYVSSDNEAVS